MIDDSTATTHACATEEEVYELLGMQYIPPELRENRGELRGRARRRRCPSWSSWATSAATCTATPSPPTAATRSSEMAEAARERGYEYIAITDHSASHGFGNDVQPDELRAPDRARRGARRARSRASACSPAPRSTSAPTARSTTRTTCSSELDWVVASVHTSFRMSEKEMTERMIARDGAPAGRRDRPPDRAADRPPRALRDRHGAGDRGGRRAPARSSRSTPTRTGAT